MAKLKDFIVRTKIGNTDENQKMGNPAFDTQDYMFIERRDEVRNLSDDKRVAYPSDYAVMNGAFLRGKYSGPKKDKQPTWHWLRSTDPNFKGDVNSVGADGSLSYCHAYSKSAGLCQSMHLDLSAIISARKVSDKFKIEPFKDKDGKILYHTIEFGEYPFDKADISDELEELFKHNILTSNGKTYTGYMNNVGSFQQNQEFYAYGKKYVRVISKKHDDDSEYKDGTEAPETGTPMRAEVQPLKWIIRNWNDLPKEQNPEGNGTAKTIYVRSEEGLMSGIPFYPGRDKIEYTMWQNSPIRAMFNGYDLHKEINKGNGNSRYKADTNFNFVGNGFIDEAFDIDLPYEITSSKEGNKSEMEPQVRKTRLEKLNPDTTPASERRDMTDTEIIKSWIDAGQSVLLRGPSGIGKTERIKSCIQT